MLNITDRLRRKFGITNEFARSVLCEFVCTTFLIYGGTAVTAQYVLSRTRNNAYIGVTLGWGFSLVFAVQLGFKISGSHLNPAVSLFLLSFGKISVARFFAYSAAQMAGGFFGAALTYITYYDAINAFDHGKRYVSGPLATASIFATYPQSYLTVAGGIIDQIAGTVMLCICVSLITDPRNKIPTWLQPLYIGFTIMLVGMAVGMNSGYAVNPARDFGPRLFTFCAGYGHKVFSYNNYCWFWIPIVAPLLGALIGSWVYQFFIGIHMTDEMEIPTQVVYKPHPPQILDVRTVQVDNDYKRSIGSENNFVRR